MNRDKTLFIGPNICSSLEQYNDFEQHYWELFYGSKRLIEKKTGCLSPCTYNEYKVVKTRSMALTHGKFGLFVSYGSTDTIVRKELYILNFVTFVSNYGGSLGLFVGFSFFMIWDIVGEVVVVSMKTFTKTV